MKPSNTPKELGFRFPAEWEKHESTWLTYPQINESWPLNFVEVCREYNEFIKLISKGEKVNIITDSSDHTREIQGNLNQAGVDFSQLIFHEFGSDDSWCRDHGPEFLINTKIKEKALVKWEYNAWGGKYEFNKDNEIGNRIVDLLKLKTFRPGIIMEGGSIDVNGNGTLLTTKACLLNKNRNQQFDQKQIEEYLKEYYCVSNIIWLGDGIEGDDTDGHVDDITRFVSKEIIVSVVEENKKSSNYQALFSNLKTLQSCLLENGKRPEIIELPTPDSIRTNEQVFPASYANFYICNYGVIVPVFGSKNDVKALDILQKCFPDRKVIGLPSNNVIYGLGSWHCLSKQEATLPENKQSLKLDVEL